MTPVFYSCVTGAYDNPEKAILASIPEFKINTSIRFVFFTDVVTEPTTKRVGNIEWDIQPLRWQHPFDRRRTARWHKVNSHILFPNASTIWADGSQILTGDPADLLDYVKDMPIATFKHPERNCIYQEVEACVRLRKDNPTLMYKQVDHYRKEWNHPPYGGLVETACVVRVATPKVAEFNKLWWAEIDRHSYRDQLSFNPVAWKLGIRVNHIPGCRAQSPYFKFVPHKG